jgi:hypothetical protein
MGSLPKHGDEIYGQKDKIPLAMRVTAANTPQGTHVSHLAPANCIIQYRRPMSNTTLRTRNGARDVS